MNKNRSRGIYLLLTALAVLASACGGEWEKISKKGNTWEFNQGSKKKALTAKVKEKYQIGKREYAELNLKTAAGSSSIVISWNKDKQTFLYAGRGSYTGEKKPVFFIKETALAKLKNKKNDKVPGEDGTTITFLGEDKIKTPAGATKAFKFSRTGTNKITGNKISQMFWYVSKKGIFQFKDNSGTLKLARFTEGKGGKAVTPAGKLDAGKAIAVARSFYTKARSKGLAALLPLFTDNGKKLTDNNKTALKMLISRMKTGTRPEKSAVFFPGGNKVGIRFRYTDESGSTPELMYSDSILELVTKDKKMLIKMVTTAYKKVLQ